MFKFLLYPASWLYKMAVLFRHQLFDWGILHSEKFDIPVICIGNITVGGTGKTPLAEMIVDYMSQTHRVALLSRGYGRRTKGYREVAATDHYRDVGDEPLQIKRKFPDVCVVVCERRADGIRRIRTEHPEVDLIVMDDGFQNPGLYKDLSFLVFDGGFGIGNGLSVPAGPLRENFAAGLKRAHAAIILGEDKHNLSAKIAGIPIFRGSVVPVRPEVSNTDAVAFAGIGRPEKFYASMRELGFNLVETVDFPDHHRYTAAELNRLIDKARSKDALLFTTAKDFVKIPTQMQKYFRVLEIEIRWEDEAALSKFILDNIR